MIALQTSSGRSVPRSAVRMQTAAGFVSLIRVNSAAHNIQYLGGRQVQGTVEIHCLLEATSLSVCGCTADPRENKLSFGDISIQTNRIN